MHVRLGTTKPQILLFMIATFVSLAQTVASQDLDNITISGRVIDQNGAVIAGARVTATLVSINRQRTVTTDGDGAYRLLQLAPGSYNVKASAGGFTPEERTNLVAIAAQNVALNFILKPASVTAGTVVISAADNQVDTARTVVGGTVTAREIESLPIASRSPIDLIFTMGGVAEEPLSVRDLALDPSARTTPEEAGNFSISGGTAYSNNITIDGLDNNDDRSAQERFTPSMEAVAEVQVIRNQFAAEYGRASGGRLNLRTQSGRNDWRGRAFYFFRDESLNANSWKNNTLGIKRLPLQEHDPGFTLSGPIVIPHLYGGNARSFFFASYEYDTFLESTLIDTLVPLDQNPLFALPDPTNPAAKRAENPALPALAALNGLAPFISSVSTPQRNHIFSARVDQKWTGRHDGSFLFQMGHLKNLRQFGGGDRLAQALIGKTHNTEALAYSDNFVLSSKAVAQTRVQFSQLRPAVAASGGAQSPVVLITIKDSAALNSGTLIAGSSTAGATDRSESRIQFQDILAYVRAAHSVKLGADLQRIKSSFIDLSDVTGTWNFDSAGDFLANLPSRFRQNFLTTSIQRNHYAGLFVQDEWGLRSNLMLSYGLRYEYESIIKDRNNFGPRLAFAYDPFRSGKTVIRTGVGIFYNRALLRTIDDFTTGAQQLFFDTDTLSDPATGKIMSDTQRRSFIATNLRFPQRVASDSPLIKQLAVSNSGTKSAGGVLRRLDPALRIPESYQANVGIEREMGRALVVEANYTWNRTLHLWREYNLNAPALPRGFRNFTDYLASRDFANFLSKPGGIRPVLNTSAAGDLVRFVLSAPDPANPNSVGRVTEFGVPVSLVNLNALSSTTAVNAALAALNFLRPDSTKGEIEQLIPVGRSFYHGLTVDLRNHTQAKRNGAAFSFRAAYTLSFLKDDGVVNTSDALRPGDFQREMVYGLQDRRHRLVISGTWQTPAYLGRWHISPLVRLASGAPFNIGIGSDRNLDDVDNDRPIFTGDISQLRWRRPGQPIQESILNRLALPAIGQTGNLPRNAGRGPGLFAFDFQVTREFKLTERLSLRPVVEIFNVLNKTIFNFGSEFIDFNALSPASSAATRQAFIDSFLIPTRTLRPREIRIGMRMDF
jgi:hypothetical protein